MRQINIRRSCKSVKQYAMLALFLIACLAVGGIGSIATVGSVFEWYPLQSKPLQTPRLCFWSRMNFL